MKYKAVTVDFGNTLVGFKPAFYEKAYQVLKDNGYDLDIRKVFRAYAKLLGMINYPNEDGLVHVDPKDLLYVLGIYPNQRLVRELSEAKDDEAFLYEDSLEFLEAVKSYGFKLALVSNASPRARTLLEKFDLKKYFDVITLSYEVKVLKPNPKIFGLTLAKVGYPAIHIGDIYEVDYIGAKRSYIDSILIDRYDFYPDIKDRVRNLREALKKIEELNEEE